MSPQARVVTRATVTPPTVGMMELVAKQALPPGKAERRVV